MDYQIIAFQHDWGNFWYVLKLLLDFTNKLYIINSREMLKSDVELHEHCNGTVFFFFFFFVIWLEHFEINEFHKFFMFMYFQN